MNNFFNNLKQEAEHIKLSQNEKQAMRLSIQRAIQTTTRIEQVKSSRAVKSPYVWFSPKFATPFAAVLVVLLGSGTAYASQAALPGDALYAIKVNVTEPAMGALAFSDEAKAQWHAEVAETRLEEAETLAAEGKLDAETSAKLAENFDAHSNQAVVLAQKVESVEAGAGAEIAAQIDSTLEAHDAILEKVSLASKTHTNTERVAERVRDRGSVTLALANIDLRVADSAVAQDAPAPMMMKTTFSSESTSTAEAASTSAPTEPTTNLAMQAKVQTNATVSTTSNAAQNAQIKAIAKLKKSAGTALADAKKAYAAVKKSLDATTTAQVELKISQINEAIVAADSTESFTVALKDATSLKTMLKASKTLKRNLFTNVPFANSNSNAKNRNSDKNTPATSTPAVKGESEAEVEVHATTSDTVERSSGKDREDEKNDDKPSIFRSLLNAF